METARTCLVTGANSGIGFEVAHGLAARGDTVAMLCRDPDRGMKALERIQSSTGNDRLELLLCDLASQPSIHAAAAAFRRRHKALHVLVHNAGMQAFRRTATADGIETVFAVNVVAPHLLTNLLRSRLLAGTPSRVVTLAGASHRKGAICFDDLQGEERFDGMRATRQAQLARVLFTRELARLLANKRVTANCIHPGAVRTGLQRKLPWPMRMVAVPMSLFFRSPRSGAAPVLRLATSQELAGVSGAYFERFRQARAGEAAYDELAARRLWRVCEALTGGSAGRAIRSG